MLVSPAVYVSLYYVYGLLPIGSYWAFTKSDLFTVRSISLFGIPGLLFAVIFSQACIAHAFANRSGLKKIFLLPSPIIFFSLLCFGLVSSPLKEGTLNAGIIQPNLPLDEKWRKNNLETIIDKYCSLASAAAEEGADIVFCPQYSLPCSIDSPVFEKLCSFAGEHGVYLVLGTYIDLFNTAILISPDGSITDQYSGYGTPPFRDGEQNPAYQLGSFALESGRIGILLCYDDTSSSVARKLVNEHSSGLLAAPVNDGYFSGTLQPLLHLSRTINRAIETNRYLVRSAATGISCIIDPYGRIIKSIDFGSEGYIVGKVDFRKHRTLFCKTGDIASRFSVALLILLTFTGFHLRKH